MVHVLCRMNLDVVLGHWPDSHMDRPDQMGQLDRTVGTTNEYDAKSHEWPRGTSDERVQVLKGYEFQTVPLDLDFGRFIWIVCGCTAGRTYSSFNRSVVSQGQIGCKAIRMGLGLTRLYGSRPWAGSGKKVREPLGQTYGMAD